MRKLIPFIFICFICLISSCRNDEKEALNSYIRERIGKLVVFPDSLEYRSLYDSLPPLPTKKIKIITFINGECYACLNQFIDWQEIGDTFIRDGNVDILFYVRSLDFYSIRQVLVDVDFRYPFYIDPHSDILYLNSIPYDKKNLQTFLADQNNRIILIGSPVHNPKMMNLYKQEIRRLTRNN